MDTNNIINTNSSNNTTATYLVPKAVGFETPILGTGNAVRNDCGFLGGFLNLLNSLPLKTQALFTWTTVFPSLFHLPFAQWDF